MPTVWRHWCRSFDDVREIVDNVTTADAEIGVWWYKRIAAILALSMPLRARTQYPSAA